MSRRRSKVLDAMCAKIRYPDELGARVALANCKAKGERQSTKLEKRAYRCDRCHGWHLTSLAPAREGLI